MEVEVDVFYEELQVGNHLYHEGGRTLTDTDSIWFALITCNTHQVHYNSDYAARTEFGKPLIPSTLTLAVVAGLTVSDLSRHAVANLAWSTIELPNPVFAGDTLYADSTVLSKRESKSRPGAGVIGVRTWGRNQSGTTILTFDRTFLVYKRAHHPDAMHQRVRQDWAAATP